MHSRTIGIFLAMVMVVIGGAGAQPPGPVEGEEEPFPIFFEVCGNGVDDNGDGLADCFDPSCSGDPSCGGDEICEVGEVEEEGATEPLFAVGKQLVVRPCSNNVTDSDGRSFTTPGCLTYWDSNDIGCTQTIINYVWDQCNGNTLTEFYTGAANKKDCSTRGRVDGACSRFVTCPGGAIPMCVTQNLPCGPQNRNIGFCVCPAILANGGGILHELP